MVFFNISIISSPPLPLFSPLFPFFSCLLTQTNTLCAHPYPPLSLLPIFFPPPPASVSISHVHQCGPCDVSRLIPKIYGLRFFKRNICLGYKTHCSHPSQPKNVNHQRRVVNQIKQNVVKPNSVHVIVSQRG